MAPKNNDKNHAPKGSPDMSLITDKRKEEIRAAAFEKVQNEKRKAAEALYEAQSLSEARGETTKIHDAWLDEMEEVVVSLPPKCASDHISIDNVWYFHGRSYTLPRSKCMVIRETCDKAWRHEEIALRGKDENAYRKVRNPALSMKASSVVNTADNFKV